MGGIENSCIAVYVHFRLLLRGMGAEVEWFISGVGSLLENLFAAL